MMTVLDTLVRPVFVSSRGLIVEEKACNLASACLVVSTESCAHKSTDKQTPTHRHSLASTVVRVNAPVRKRWHSWKSEFNCNRVTST